MKAYQPRHQKSLHFDTWLRDFKVRQPAASSRPVSTDQVIICMLGLEHPGDVLQVVRVDLLGAPPGEGHGDDTLSDIRQVKFISLLHPERWDFRPVKNKKWTVVTQAFQLHGVWVNIWWSKSSALVIVSKFSADIFEEWPQFLIAWQRVPCLLRNGQQCASWMSYCLRKKQCIRRF